MRIDFRDTYSHWHKPNGALPDELHVEPKTQAIRYQLTLALETDGEIVRPIGVYATRYKVVREEAGTFVLVNARGG